MPRQHQLAAKPRARNRVAVRRSPEHNLRRFGRPIRRTVQALALRHTHFADLAVSFPALLVALAVPRLGFDPRAARAAVVAGRPLTEIASLAAVPMWLRKLPPEALTRAIPELPGGELFARRIANCVPKNRKRVATWLHALAAAHALAHEPFAVWIAPLIANGQLMPKRVPFTLMGLWAWFSRQPDTIAGQLASANWSPAMNAQKAEELARQWITDVEVTSLRLVAGNRPAWLSITEFEGYEFVALDKPELLREEGRRMQNCVADYTREVARGECQIWSVRARGRRVATVNVSPATGDHYLAVREIQGHDNTRVPLEVAAVTRRWLHAHGEAALVCSQAVRQYGEEHELFQQLLKPYRLAKPRFRQWLPLMMDSYDLCCAWPRALL